MKTFTKTMSMILIAVMCFSMLATSAFAMDFSLDGSDPAPSFSAGNDDSSFSFGNGFDDSNFSLGTSVAQPAAPAQDVVTAPQAATSSDNGFSLNNDANSATPAENASASGEKKDDEFVFEENEMLKAGDPASDLTFSIDKINIQKTMTDAEATVTITATGGTWAEDTFPGGYFYTEGDPTGKTGLRSLDNFKFDSGTLTLFGSWLKSLTGGKTYYFFGQPLGKPIVPIGAVTVTNGDPGDLGTYTVSPTTYTQHSVTDPNPYKTSVSVIANDTSKNFSQFAKYAVIPQGASSGGRYADGEVNVAADKSYVTFSRTFLDSLNGGWYDIYGETSSGLKVKLGSVYIKGGTGGNPAGTWTLWPDYSIPWTSGDDPLMFKSNLMAKRQSYPSYTIVPRYGFGAGSTPNNMIDVNQFWDMGDGVFALGTNFLRSLPAGTYTLQVVDYKHLNDCTNVVTFKIGSTLRPIDTDKHVIGSIKNLRFLCDEPVYEVYVGNIPLTYGEDYALSNGNKTITLSFEFLNKRSAGNTYTIKALTASGTYPSTTFQILSTAQGSASPRTGDESNLGLWAAFLLLSGAAIVVLVPKLRKHDF